MFHGVMNSQKPAQIANWNAFQEDREHNITLVFCIVLMIWSSILRDFFGGAAYWFLGIFGVTYWCARDWFGRTRIERFLGSVLAAFIVTGLLSSR